MTARRLLPLAAALLAAGCASFGPPPERAPAALIAPAAAGLDAAAGAFPDARWWSALGVGTLAFGFAFTLFEILVAVLQAYVFALLTAVYIQLAVAEEH